MDAYDAPNTGNNGPAPISMPARVLAAFCLMLGTIGLLMTCCGGFSTLTTQLAPEMMGIQGAQLEVMQAAQAEQGWWVIPFTFLHLLAKTVLSVGLIVGSGFVMADKPNGPRLLTPVLIYGIVFELAVGLWGLGYTLFNYETMGQQFGDSMSASPDIPTELGQLAGEMFGPMMIVGTIVMLGWALVKAGLYGGTLFSLRASETD